MCVQTSEFANICAQIKQTRVTFSHLKLWVVVWRHNFSVKIKIIEFSRIWVKLVLESYNLFFLLFKDNLINVTSRLLKNRDTVFKKIYQTELIFFQMDQPSFDFKI